MKDISDTYLADIELSHHLQRQILNCFLHASTRTYSQLLIDGMSGNSFIYHLKALIRQKLIAKTGPHVYELTALGKLVLDSISFETSRFRLRPTTGVFLVARTTAGEYMLYRSKRQPFIDYTGFIFGKSRIGQDFSEIIERISSRRNLGQFRQIASSAIDVIYRQNGLVISHRTGLIVLVEVDEITPERETAAGVTFWVKPDELKGNILPEIGNCLEYIGRPYIEINSVVVLR